MADKEQYFTMADEELISTTLSGDKEAFSFLLSKYQERLHSFVTKYAPITQDAEDICQDCYQKVYLSLKDYDSNYAFSTWLFHIAKNTAIDHFRRKSSGQALFFDSDDDDITEAGGSVSSPEDKLIGSETQVTILDTIEKMDPIYRQVAELRFVKEFAYEEIAKELDLPLNTVRTRIRRAKEQLSDLIKK